MSILADAIIRDVIASRPAFGTEGRLFYASDTGAQYYDTGAAWVNITGALSVTTKGDVQGFSTAPARVPVGANGQVLTADSGAAPGVSWQTPAAGGGGVIGTAKFSGAGGVVGGLVKAGNVSGVTRTGSGQYTVALTGSPTDYLVLTGIGDTASGVTIQLDPISGYGTSGFVLQVLANAVSVYDSVGLVFIAIVKM